MSRLWSLVVFSRPLWWQKLVSLTSVLCNHMVCLWCYACVWPLHFHVETVFEITRNVMGTRRRTQQTMLDAHPCLQFHGISSSLCKHIQWAHVRKWSVLTVIHLLMWVCGTYMFVGFKRYFHPGEGRVNIVTTRVWFQDAFSEFRGVGPNVCFNFQEFFFV